MAWVTRCARMWVRSIRWGVEQQVYKDVCRGFDRIWFG
jgi:hypothetical protein